ncbi:MAG TPA: helix-turn-helix domain-containing protein [Draconibacterium sp.]|nr:helix-turn-helix domain-containing protein [Draconibacterium sp.]
MLKAIALLSPLYITLFWSVVFFIQIDKVDKSKINLGIFMVTAFLLYFSHVIFFSNQYKLYSFIEVVYIFSSLSVYPMYFIYIFLLTSNKLVSGKFLFHFVPAIILSVIALVITLFLSPEERILYVKDTLIENNLKGLMLSSLTGIKGLIFLLSRIIFVFQAVYYLIRGVSVAKNHSKRIGDYYSNTEGKTLNWIKFLNIIFLIVSVLSIFFAVVGRSSFAHNEVLLLIPSILFSVLLFTIGIHGNRLTPFNTEFNLNQESVPEIFYGQNEKLKNQLLQLFEKTRIYKQPDLRITTVSESLKSNRTYISKMINEEFQLNFNEFVNKYRVDEAKQLLAENESDLYTMEYIAEKSGFGSVNSFTRVFKSAVGMPPGKYRGQNITFTPQD